MRTLTSLAQYKAMAALWLLAPGTPMPFQGQEFGATNPFPYFADHAESPVFTAILLWAYRALADEGKPSERLVFRAVWRVL
ncbi:MAG: hypothetical protein JO284_15875 [Planctomycetaceae bacterium]|nr:hypothetical protein [Planctomycetaceae bacterium]